MQKTFTLLFLIFFFIPAFSQDLVSGGSNAWIFHTPDDGRTTLHIAPLVNGAWQWETQTMFSANGDVNLSGTLGANRGIFGGNVKIFGREEPWAEGLCIVKPDGWLGVRFARKDPATGDYGGNWALGYNGTSGDDFSITNNFQGVQYNYLFHIKADTRNVGIGTSNPDSKLTVKGKIHAEEVKVDLSVPGPDYVFEKNYDLKSLSEIETYVLTNKHLPEVPSATQMKDNGVNMGEMQMKLLQKIEELTLHLIEQNKRLDIYKKDQEQQNSLIQSLQKQLSALKNKSHP